MRGAGCEETMKNEKKKWKRMYGKVGGKVKSLPQRNMWFAGGEKSQAYLSFFIIVLCLHHHITF